MAKDINVILNEMDTEQTAQPALTLLNSVSVTAVYTAFKKVFALGGKLLFDAWDIVREEINQIASAQIIGTKQWYVNLAKGYSGGTIVQRASALEVGTKVILKVAAVTGGQTAQLSSTNLNNLRAYIYSKKVAGTDLDIISQTADLVSLVLSIKYSGVMATVKAAVIAAIKSYLDTLPFDSSLSKTLLEQIILSVPGVLDCSVDVMSIDYGLGYQVITANTALPDAGYFEVGKSGGNDLITANMYT